MNANQQQRKCGSFPFSSFFSLSSFLLLLPINLHICSPASSATRFAENFAVGEIII
jgi:hypothetical protein